MYSLSPPPGVSSSISVAVIASGAYPVAVAVIVAVPLTVSASWAAATVAVTPVFQFAGVSVTVAGETVMSASPVRARATATLPVGAALSFRLTAPVPPSATLTEDGVAIIVGPVAAVTVNARSAVAVAFALSYARAWTV